MYDLSLIEDLIQLFFGDSRVLHRVRGVLVPKLTLNRCDVAGLLYQMPPHSVPRGMRRASRDAGELGDIIPDVIYHPLR